MKFPLCYKEKQCYNVKERMKTSQKFAYGVGHILNDLAANTWFSYLLVFMNKVAGLSSGDTGLVLLLGQVTDALCTPFIGYLNDRTVCKYGRRKLWHFIGAICVCTTFPLIFNKCLGCTDASSKTKLGYYYAFAAVFQFGWGCAQLSHLSLIPEIAKRFSERVELNAIRSAVTFLCGIFVYGVTWVLLGQSSEQTLNPGVWKQFMYLAFIVVGVGTFFNVIFHICINEPPCDALLEREKNRKKEGKNKKDRSKKNDKKALLQVSCSPSSASRRSGASLDVVTKLCEKTCKKKQDHCNGTVISASAPNVEGNDQDSTDKSAVILNYVDKDQIHNGGRTWKHWLKEPGFYKVALVYMCSRLVVNISQSYLPLYLTETLKFEKEAIAYFPLVVLISGVVASAAVKPLNKRMGSKITFSLGAVMSTGACFWFFVQTEGSRNAIYATAVLMGCGGSVMLVTSLALISELIAHDNKSGAFVYGSISFADKLSTGVVIAVIQQLNPRTNSTATCLECEEFLRYVQSCAPGSSAVVALLLVVFFFDSIFVCKKKPTTTEIGIQTNMEGGDTANDVISGLLTNGHLRTGDVTPQVMIEVDSERSDGEDKEENRSVTREEENNLFLERNLRRPKSRTFDDYAAMRLASPFLPSPVLERRTIL